MNLKILYPLLTEAIQRAERLEELHHPDAYSAYFEVSLLEEKVAGILPASNPEGALARRGAVRAALAAMEFRRALQLTERFLAEPEADTNLQAALLQLLEQSKKNGYEAQYKAAKAHPVFELLHAICKKIHSHLQPQQLTARLAQASKLISITNLLRWQESRETMERLSEPGRQALGLGLGIGLSLLLLTFATVFAQPLAPGRPLERGVGQRTLGIFPGFLERGQAFSARMEQLGVDADIRLLNPEGREIAAIDSLFGARGTEVLYAVASESGRHRLELRLSLINRAFDARYNLKLAQPRQASQQDRQRFHAVQLLRQGIRAVGREELSAARQSFLTAAGLLDSGDRELRANALYRAGRIAVELGQQAAALENYNEAATSGEPVERAYAFYQIGKLKERLGMTGALASFQHSTLEALEADDRLLAAWALNEIGMIYGQTSQPQEAAEAFYRSQALWPPGQEPAALAGVRLNLSKQYYLLGQNLAAQDYFARAQQMTRSLLTSDRGGIDPYRIYSSLYVRARALRDLERFPQARRAIDYAIPLAESIRLDAVGIDGRERNLSKIQDLYGLSIALRMQAGEVDQAFELAEQARARTLLQNLAGRRLGALPITPDLDARRSALARQIGEAYLEEGLARLNAPAGSLTSENDARLRRLSADLLEIQAEIEGRVALQGQALAVERPLTLSQVQQQLDTGTVLLFYSLGVEQSFGWAISSSAVEARALGPKQPLQVLVHRVYGELQRPPRYGGHDLPSTRQQLADLTRVLLTPFAESIRGKSLVVIVDGALALLPFSVLPDPDDPTGATFLAARHDLILAPSAAVGLSLNEKAYRQPLSLSVASLWSVDDLATSTLLARFYKGMKEEGLSAPAALRIAQNSVRADSRWHDPYYWSGFILEGSSLPLD